MSSFFWQLFSKINLGRREYSVRSSKRNFIPGGDRPVFLSVSALFLRVGVSRHSVCCAAYRRKSIYSTILNYFHLITWYQLIFKTNIYLSCPESPKWGKCLCMTLHIIETHATRITPERLWFDSIYRISHKETSARIVSIWIFLLRT